MSRIIKLGKEDCRHLYDEIGCIESVDTFLTCLYCGREVYLTQGKDYSNFIDSNRELIHPDKLKLYDEAKKNLEEGNDFF
jgi:hypothetical protein